MPAVASGKVLVTGANGYIAVWLVQKLLEQGYSVRGTIRTAARGKYLKKLFEKYGDKFELVVVEDITKVRFVFFYTAQQNNRLRTGRRVRRGGQGC